MTEHPDNLGTTTPLEEYWAHEATLKEIKAVDVYDVTESQAHLDVQAIWDHVKKQRREAA